MSLTPTLDLAIEMAEREREQAEQAVARALKGQQHAEGQLGQLEGYAAETQQRWSTAQATHVSAVLMAHHQSFQQRLQQAIELQRGVVRQGEQRVAAARQLRVQKELRLRGLVQLRTQKLAAHRRSQDRREQKALDELATQRFLRGAQAPGYDLGESA
jgi:flagellar FliJ protein